MVKNISVIVMLMCLVMVGCQSNSNKDKDDEPKLKLNSIQVIGSHNSYKRPIEPNLLKLLQEQTSNTFEGLQYGHSSLTDQLDKYGLRNLEIDVLYDPQGGRFANPYGLKLLKQKDLEARSNCSPLSPGLATQTARRQPRPF